MIPKKSLLVEVFSPQNPRNRVEVELEISSERRGLYTALPQEVLEKFGVKTDITIQHFESNDRLITLPLWQIGISVHGRESITLATSSKEASIGYLTLAELGLMLRDEEPEQITTYDDPLIYFFTFDWAPDTYRSAYSVKQARELYRELLCLYDEWIFALNNKNILEEWATSSFATAVMSIVFYNLNSMFASFYTGVLPSIALSLRLSLEALIAGYYADLDPKLREKYPDRLIRLERSSKYISKYIHGKSFREFCEKRLVNYTVNTQAIMNLWHDVSFKFIHSVGLIRAISRSREPPSIAMGGPFAAYGKGDEGILSQLTTLVRRYMEIFTKMVDEWLQRKQEGLK